LFDSLRVTPVPTFTFVLSVVPLDAELPSLTVEVVDSDALVVSELPVPRLSLTLRFPFNDNGSRIFPDFPSPCAWWLEFV
jgi:hypothetical protein